MALKAAICENCGGSIEVDESFEKGICPFCGTQFYTEKIIHNTYITNNYTVQGTDINNCINLADKYCLQGQFENADTVITEGLLVEPENQELWNLKITSICGSMLSKLTYSITDIQKLRNGNTTFFNDINIDEIYKSLKNSLIYLPPDSVSCQKACDSIVYYFTKTHSMLSSLKLTCTNYIETASSNSINEQQKNNINDLISQIKLKNSYIIHYLLAFINTSKFSDKAIDSFLNFCLDEVKQTKPLTVRSILYESTLILKLTDELPKMENVTVTAKNGKSKEPLYLGTYIIYCIKQNHPNFNSPNLSEVATLLASKDKGGCYIATAVYGSYNCPQVWTLRRFRDYTLSSTWYGRCFIKTYYFISPTLVKLFGKTHLFKKIFEFPLNKLVNRLNNSGVSDEPYDDIQW